MLSYQFIDDFPTWVKNILEANQSGFLDKKHCSFPCKFADLRFADWTLRKFADLQLAD